ncbi:hypothetical protein ACRAWB_04040 [Leifsonia poae]|uniref:hypothetical protein n=1 Tax=Leifsonia poae TaxID=110933 RepID=UPI003D688DE3
MPILFSIGWIVLVATAMIVFRRRIVDLLMRIAAQTEDEVSQRRDLTIGVILVAAFIYVLAGSLAAYTFLPAALRTLPLAIGLPVCGLLAILYWVRFSNAGLSVLGWLRR